MSSEVFDRGDFIAYFRDEASELLDRMDTDLLGLESGIETSTCDIEVVNALFRSLHTIKGSAGMLDFTIVQRVAHRLENVIDLLRSEKISLDETLLELTFIGRDLLGTLIDRAIAGETDTIPEVDEYIGKLESFVESVGVDNNAVKKDPTSGAEAGFDNDDAIARFEAEIERLLADQEEQAKQAALAPADAASTASDAVVSAATVPAVHTAAKPPASVPASTIRVDLERLDLLLDLVGELVINRTRITATVHAIQVAMTNDPSAALSLTKDLATTSSTLARITNELQESVMKARMVPVGQVFERFPRTVRDLAKTTGKQIALVTSGVETDLDKTIVDHIGEPLMHLVRNCADHGLEMPDVRVAAGKDATGTIQLNAYHEGNQVIIEVGDDGGGISLDKVRARGIDRGLIDANTHYSDAEIVDLIFAPGFSTAEVVTGISGRGVGMDVVRKSVLELKGQLDVTTKVGEGSMFTIRLPLTLAIIRTLLVRVANRLFAIPLDVVIESQRVPRKEVRTISGNAVVMLRGQVIPLVMMRNIFDLGVDEHPQDYVMVVIIVHKGKRVGIGVDSFECEQEIVIKPLSEIMGKASCIAGATILGNGEIALILDIAALAVDLPRLEHSSNQESLDQDKSIKNALESAKEVQLV